MAQKVSKLGHLLLAATLVVLALLCLRMLPAGEALAEESVLWEQDEPSLAQEESAEDNIAQAEQLLVVYAADAPLRALSEGDASADDTYQILEEEVVSEEPGEEGTGVTTLVTVAPAPDVSLDDVMERMSEDPSVLYVQRNFTYHLPPTRVSEDEPLQAQSDELTAQASTNDPYGYTQYYLRPWNVTMYGNHYFGANLSSAWDLVKTSGAVEVAVVDTGCMPKHEDLVANLDTTYMKDLVKGTPAGTIDDGDKSVGHGTHVCGTVAAVANNGKGIAGTSYNARVLPLKVFDDDGASTITLVKALDYLISLKKANKLPKLHVINMSLCLYPSEYDNPEDAYDRAMHDRIKTLRNTYNVLTVCAGGNGNGDGTPRTDACYPSDWAECLSVTALTEGGENIPWSDYNAAKDISAPGDFIFSTNADGSKTNSYMYLSGTSMASPIVAGTAALLWAAVPNLTVSQAVTSIRATAQKLSPTGANYHAKTGSAGAIDAEAAVRYAVEHYGTRTDISSASIAAVSKQTYTGSAITPKPNVTFQGKTLVEGTDFAYSYTNNTNAGTATIKVTGTGFYKGSVSTSFTIAQASMSKATYAAVADRQYTGSPIRPRPSVTFNGRTLGQFVDYALSYANNTAIGQGWIYVEGKGNFTGTLYVPFDIVEHASFANPFADVNKETAHYADILWLAQQDISTGWVDSNGTRTFRPNAAVKRGDMAAFLYRLADNWGLVNETWMPKNSTIGSFSDVSASTSHAHEIWWLAESGISLGWTSASGKTFRPNAEVKRGDMAAFLFRLAALAERGGAQEGWKPTAAQAKAFVDVNTRTSHNIEIAWLAAQGISVGWTEANGTKTFRPNDTVKRGDMAAFLHRLDALE